MQFMPTSLPHIEELLRDLLAALQDLYGDRPHNVVLYGSHAAGQRTNRMWK